MSKHPYDARIRRLEQQRDESGMTTQQLHAAFADAVREVSEHPPTPEEYEIMCERMDRHAAAHGHLCFCGWDGSELV